MRYLRDALFRVDAVLAVRRVTFVALALFLLLYTFFARFSWDGLTADPPGAKPMMPDYAAHLVGAHIALEGDVRRLYDLDQQVTVQDRFLGSTPAERLKMHKRPQLDQASNRAADAEVARHFERYAGLRYFISPPFVAYLYMPLAALPYTTGAAIWLILTLVLVALSLRLLWPLVPRLHRYGLGRVLLLALSTASCFAVLLVGQDSALSLLLFALGLRLLLAHRDVAGGALLGLGVFKPHFFLMVPVLLLLQRRWRALGAWTAVAGALTGVSLALVGLDGAHAYIALLTSDAYHLEVDLLQAGGMLSVMPLMRMLGLASYAGIVGGGCALFLAAAFGPLAAKLRDDRNFSLLYAVAILIAVVVMPHVWVYDGLVLLLPALILLNQAPTSAGLRVSFAAAYVLTWLAPLQFGPFGGPWTVVPLIILLLIARRLLLARKIPEAGGRPTAVAALLERGSDPAFG